MSEYISAREFLTIKSDQFNYEHFIGGPQVFTVSRISQKAVYGNKRMLIHMDGHDATPFVPSSGMIKCLMSPDGWGENLKDWIGKRIKLYGDPGVKKGSGEQIGGVRIDAISGIERPYETLISERRNQRVLFRINVLDEGSPIAYPQSDFDKNLPAWQKVIAEGKMTAEQVITRAEQKGKLTDAQKALIKGGE